MQVMSLCLWDFQETIHLSTSLLFTTFTKFPLCNIHLFQEGIACIILYYYCCSSSYYYHHYHYHSSLSPSPPPPPLEDSCILKITIRNWLTCIYRKTKTLVIKNNEQGCGLPKFNLQSLLALGPWTSYLTFLTLSFIICKTEIILVVFISKDCCENQIT